MTNIPCLSISRAQLQPCLERGGHSAGAEFDDALRVTGAGGKVEAVGEPPSPWACKAIDSYLLGMPQLCLNGLSESWLLKELGHRHWMMLARLAGQSAPSFVDERGAPVYAAFCALSIRDAGFGAARENDHLVIHSKLRRLSRTQVLSHHRLTLSNRGVGVVEMVSAFVRRGAEGGNHKVSRFAVPGLPPAAPAGENHWLAGRAAAFRAGRAESHMGFSINQVRQGATTSFDPCPTQDFNGAGLLYFSSFISFVDRAEWAFCREKAFNATIRRRDVFYSGNLDPGEKLTVGLIEQRGDAETFGHHCLIAREQDGAPLARIFTHRRVHARRAPR